MPALKQLSSDLEFVAIAIASPEEWFGDCSAIAKDIIDNQQSIEFTKATNFINDYGGRIINGYEALLDLEDIDAVYIPLPPALHYKWAKLALGKGKHVYLEKPFTTTESDTLDLIGLAEQNGLALHENYMFVFHKQIEELNNIVKSGEIGDVRLYRVTFGFPRRQVGDFRYNKRLGGGVLYDVAGYTLKYASLLLGKTARITTSHLNYVPDFEIDMFGAATMVNDRGDIAQLAFGMDNDYRCDIEVWGSKGTITSNRILTAPVGFVPTYTIKKNQDYETRKFSSDDSFLKSILRFKQCVDDIDVRQDNYQIIAHQASLIELFKLKAK